jgi:LEA14-like dessication related protein
MIRALAFLWLCVLLSGCKITAPEFRRIENVQLENIGAEGLRLGLDMILYNPNGLSCTLEKVQLDVFLDDQSMGSLNDQRVVHIQKKAEFAVPLSLRLKPQGNLTDLFKNLLQVFAEKKAELFLQGSIQLRRVGKKITVPVKQKRTIPLRLP